MRKLILRVTMADGSVSETLLREDDMDEKVIHEDELTGLRFDTSMEGIHLLEKPGYSKGIRVPVRFTPAIWGLEEDEPLADILEELKRCGRDPWFWIGWDYWLINDGDWVEARFILETSR